MNSEKINSSNTELKKACEIWDKAIPAPPTHPYLLLKRVKPYSLKISERGLEVPGYINGKLVSLLAIPNDGGQKMFLKGSTITGSYYKLGQVNDQTIYIAEGFATAATIHEDNSHCVYCAFTCNNLKHVAVYLRDKYPELDIIICGDDDYRTTNNPGRKHAIEAAKAAKAAYTFPDFTGLERGPKDTDFNDLARLIKESNSEH